jgi:signal transduction histidine kinase
MYNRLSMPLQQKEVWRIGPIGSWPRAARWGIGLLWLFIVGFIVMPGGASNDSVGDHAHGIDGNYQIVRGARWLDAGPASAATAGEAPPSRELMQELGRQVTLPHRLSRGLAEAQLNWYRVTLEVGAAELGKPALAACVPRWSSSAAVWIDGKALVASAPGLHGMRDWSRPQFIGLPPGLEIGSHFLDIRVRALPGLAPGLSEIWFGDGPLIRHACQAFAESRRDRAFGAALIMAVMGAVGFLLALLLRDRAAACFGSTTLLWIVHFVIASDSWRGISEHDWSLLFFATRTAFCLPMFMFCLRFAKVERRWLERGLLAAYAGAIAVLLLLPPTAWAYWLWVVGIAMLLSSLYFLTVLIRHALQETGMSGAVLAATFLFMLLSSVLDLARSFGWAAYDRASLSVLAVPLLSVAFGALLIERLVRFTHAEAKAAETLRATVARQHAKIAADFATLKAQGERLAVLEERRRIVRDMHDGVGSHLVSASALLKSEKALSKQHVTGLVDQSLQELRSVLDVLSAQPASHPDDDPVSTLLGSLRWRIAPVFESQGIALEWLAEPLPADFLPEDAARLQLLRLLQESFANIVKHARAGKVQFRSQADEDAVWIEVRDDGCGLGAGNGNAAAASAAKAGFGMQGMRERAARLGAVLDIGNADPGTRVTLRFARR